jgi:hypothetical protein
MSAACFIFYVNYKKAGPSDKKHSNTHQTTKVYLLLGDSRL